MTYFPSPAGPRPAYGGAGNGFASTFGGARSTFGGAKSTFGGAKSTFGGAFGSNLELLTREMEVATLRRNVIANNIANADTPNFKRSELNFESQLKRALESERVVPPFEQYVTNPRHISFAKPMDWRDVRPRRVLDYLTQARNNGNNVDIEQEGIDSLDNQLLYTTLAQVISSEFQRVNIVLR